MTIHSIRVLTKTLLTSRIFTQLFQHFSGCFGLEHLGNTRHFSKLFLTSASYRFKVALILLFWILWITTAAATCSTWLFLRENAGGYAHCKMGWSPNFWAAAGGLAGHCWCTRLLGSEPTSWAAELSSWAVGQRERVRTPCTRAPKSPSWLAAAQTGGRTQWWLRSDPTIPVVTIRH